jgi:hypothetical protein
LKPYPTFEDIMRADESEADTRLRHIGEVLDGKREPDPELAAWWREVRERIREGGDVRAALGIYRKTGRKNKNREKLANALRVERRMRELRRQGWRGPVYDRAVMDVAERTGAADGTIRNHHSDCKDTARALFENGESIRRLCADQARAVWGLVDAFKRNARAVANFAAAVTKRPNPPE